MANQPKPLLMATELAELLRGHDQHKGDLSYLAEGTCQTVVVLAKTAGFELPERNVLKHSIVHCFVQYNQYELIGRGDDAKSWPTNRYARAALEALGFERPAAAKAA